MTTTTNNKISSHLKSELILVESDKVRKEFQAVWKIILHKMTNRRENGDIQKSFEWMKRVMEENVPFGKQTRGLGLVAFFRELKQERKERDDFLSYVLGWCIEILQAACLMADDLMDGSDMRRGVKCWYKRPSIGLSAINDAFLLENLTYQIISTYFSGHEAELHILKLTQQMVFRTVLGQSLDLRESASTTVKNFTSDIYKSIITYKTTYYTFYLPFALAMILANVKDQNLYEEIEKLMFKIGLLYQAQDDFLDCYGDPVVTGKKGTDIKEGKCTWLIVTALKHATNKQIKDLEKHYGKEDKESEKKVKKIYKELKMRTLFNDYEDDLYEEIIENLKILPKELPKEPIRKLIDSIYRRKR